MDQFEYIRTTYNVPAEYGAIILFRGNPHRIVGAENGHLIVNALGSETNLRLHPTWEVDYNWEVSKPKKLERDINICDDCYAESPYCQDCANYLVTIQREEIEELIAWKAKARPFLVSSLERLTSCFLERTDENNIRHDGIRESYKSKIKTLTELLGGSDDTTKTS